MNALRELDPAEADAWFAVLPPALRLCGLSPAFGRADVQRTSGLRCVHVGYEEGGQRWLHTFHVREIAKFGFAHSSPYGYGGPLASCEDPAFLARAWEAYVLWAGERGVLGEVCLFHPEARQERFFRGRIIPNRVTVSVDLRADPLEGQYSALARRKLRRARGLDVRWSTSEADWLAFGGFYREAMARMGAHPRYHFSDRYFAAIAAVPGVELCICSDSQGWLSSAVYLFHRAEGADAGEGTVEYHLGASTERGKQAGAAYLIQHAAAQEGRRRGLANLYLGGGTTPDEDNPLLFYKRAFSRRERLFSLGRAVHHETLFAQFVRSRGYDRSNAPDNILFD